MTTVPDGSVDATGDATPLTWRINGLQLAGLAWGSPEQRPLFALHGWLDNAASFTRLAPLLRDHYVVALDLTGHGRSDCRSADATYQIWDDLPEIVGVLDALGWESFDLLGHSRGAIIATLLAAAFPERVRHIVMLDGVSPEAVPQDAFPAQLRKGLLDKSALLGREPRIIESVDQAVASRELRGTSAYAARVITERNLRQCGDGFNWTTDARLQGASLVKMSNAQIAAVLNALSMPALLLLASTTRSQHGGYMEELARAHIGSLAVESVEGSHHFHLEDGVDNAAQLIRRFLGAPDAN